MSEGLVIKDSSVHSPSSDLNYKSSLSNCPRFCTDHTEAVVTVTSTSHGEVGVDERLALGTAVLYILQSVYERDDTQAHKAPTERGQKVIIWSS